MGWIIFAIYIIGLHVGLYGMFKKMGVAPWKALIPFYNTWIIVQHCKIKKVWFWLQFIPIAGQFISLWIFIIYVMHFGRFNVIDHTLTVFVPFIFLPYLGFNTKDRWKPEVVKLYRKPGSREWVDAIVFAVVAATIIRSFFFEAFVIPTGSMEKTLRINDFLFVNKLSYGPRIPMTPVSFPFVHNTMPFSQTTPSYLKWPSVDYKRLPGFGEVERNDVVVFNFPEGDTIINIPGYGSAIPYYKVLREQYNGNREAFKNAGVPLIIHPIDKADNYIKRCVAVGGDTIEIKAGVLYVNGQAAPVAEDAQKEYLVTTNGTVFDEEYLKNELNVWVEDSHDNLEYRPKGNNKYEFIIREKDAAALKKLPYVTNVEPIIYPPNNQMLLFPYYNLQNTIDDYGKLWIPKKGAQVTLTAENIPVYRRIITVYENHKLEEANGQFIIDGQPATTYTFKYNYYWMMGDNRHNSQDSRFWGFVPETHIVGRASFVWFSWEGGPRWSRIFKNIK